MKNKRTHRFLISILLLSLTAVSHAITWKVDENLVIDINPNPENKTFCITFTLENDGVGYVGLAFSDKLYPADTLVMWLSEESGQAMVWDAFNSGVPALESYPSALSDTDDLRPTMMPMHAQQNYTNVSGHQSNGITTLKACRAYATGDPFDYTIQAGSTVKLHAFYNMNDTWYAQNNYQQAPATSSNDSGPFIKAIKF